MMSINNLNSGVNNINDANNALSSSVSKLSSGSRINSASDDAAGMAISELLRADIATAKQSSRNISDGVSMLQTAEGAASTIHNNLSNMKQITIQAFTSTFSSEQREIMQNEFDQLAAQNDMVISGTEFNEMSLFVKQDFSVAIGDGEEITVEMEELSSISADIVNDPSGALAEIDAAITEVSAFRGELGAVMNRLESAGDVIDVEAENIMAAESRISEVDMAREVATMTSRKVQTEVAIAVQAHASTASQMILALLE